LYLQYFGLNEAPFAITPDPAFVYLSAAHRDALAHLMYGVGQGGSGGFVQLTGEVGTGKTTLCRCLLEQVPENCQVALVLNPLMTPAELLATICEELGIGTEGITGSNKALVDALNSYLMQQHAQGRRVVVVIDEAQNLSPEALEQVRLLTNLETAKHKLLQMVLLGQPELRQLLQRQDLRQLAQRITARYHLAPLDQEETRAYVVHRMKVAGAQRNPFRASALQTLYRRSGGIPRLINIIADRALAAAYARESAHVTARMVSVAADEVQPSEERVRSNGWSLAAATAAVALLLIAGVAIVGPQVWGPQLVDWNSSPVENAPLEQPAVDAGSVPVVEPESAAVPVQSVTATADKGAPAINEAGLPVGGYSASPDPIPGPPEELDPDWLAEQHRTAWQTFAGLWQDGASARAIQLACDGVERTGFACIRDQGTWSRLRQLGLPVVLVLRDDDIHLLVLRGFTITGLLVGRGDPARRVTRDAVEKHWLGEYYVAWPQAPDWPREIRRGESGEAVEIVTEMAYFAEPAWRGGAVFDEEFEAWLMAFQRRNGLRSDGIIGPKTLMYLIAPTVVAPRLELETTEGS